MGRLTLVGASGLAREVVALLRSLPDDERELVLVDDDPGLAGTEVDGICVVGGLDDLDDEGELLVCVGSGRSRRRVVSRLSSQGVAQDRYATLVHPRADVPDGCALGLGTILLSGVVLTAGVTVGDHVVVMPQVTLTHDDRVDDYATLCAGVSLGGRVTVGEAAYLGTNASVREDVRVGGDSVLGMGSALLQDLPAGQTWAGVPARPLGASSDEGRA